MHVARFNFGERGLLYDLIEYYRTARGCVYILDPHDHHVTALFLPTLRCRDIAAPNLVLILKAKLVISPARRSTNTGVVSCCFGSKSDRSAQIMSTDILNFSSCTKSFDLF